MAKRRIGIMTGGGDCPGLNAVIRAVTKTLIHRHGMEVVGLLDGFSGLVLNKTMPLTFDTVSNILTQGGTILGTSNRDNFFGVKRNESQVNRPVKSRLPDAKRVMRKLRLEGLVAIGGDGTLTVASHLNESGIPIVGVPKTIDNDVMETDQTFGFDTASTIATEAVDRLHSTAMSHQRVMIVEVMGRSAGWIALQAGLAGGGDVILIPEMPFSMACINTYVRRRFKSGRTFCIIVSAEGAYEKGRQPVWKTKAHGLSGVAQTVAKKIQDATGIECRATILGHLQRGGTPTAFDRVLATRYGHRAAELVADRAYGSMVGLKNNRIEAVPLTQVAGRPRRVPPDSPLIRAARDVGTCFGV